jgi:uncharacterized integral membrane protein
MSMPTPWELNRAWWDERAVLYGHDGSYYDIAGSVVAALIVVFIALNRDETEVSFILFSAQTPLWMALTIAAAGAFVAGFLIGRRRYRR